VVTITNRDLSAVDSGWICEPLQRVELTAKAIYYATRILQQFEL